MAHLQPQESEYSQRYLRTSWPASLRDSLRVEENAQPWKQRVEGQGKDCNRPTLVERGDLFADAEGQEDDHSNTISIQKRQAKAALFKGEPRTKQQVDKPSEGSSANFCNSPINSPELQKPELPVLQQPCQQTCRRQSSSTSSSQASYDSASSSEVRGSQAQHGNSLYCGIEAASIFKSLQCHPLASPSSSISGFRQTEQNGHSVNLGEAIHTPPKARTGQPHLPSISIQPAVIEDSTSPAVTLNGAKASVRSTKQDSGGTEAASRQDRAPALDVQDHSQEIAHRSSWTSCLPALGKCMKAPSTAQGRDIPGARSSPQSGSSMRAMSCKNQGSAFGIFKDMFSFFSGKPCTLKSLKELRI